MTLITTATAPATGTEVPIPLGSRVTHKFYEPLNLLAALNDEMKHLHRAFGPETPDKIDIEDPKQRFHAFVNKLAHVCDYNRGGDAVTSIVVLNLNSGVNPGKVHYWLAANKQTDRELQDTVVFVKSLLGLVGQAPADPKSQKEARRATLNSVLWFNRRRVGIYSRAIQSRTAACLAQCAEGGTEEDRLIATEVAKLLDHASVGENQSTIETDYLRTCEAMVLQLHQLDHSNIGAIIQSRAAEGRNMPGVPSKECWSELFHAIRRVLAYLQSVEFIFLAKNTWPQVFDSPTVSFVPSSARMSRPTRNKSMQADSIIGRMTRKEKEIQIFREFVRGLQKFDLDERIRAQYDSSSFQPIVHSEVLLLNWIEFRHGVPGTIDPLSFFNGWMYIGSSKPTCKLCAYYFEEHRSGVGYRSSHGNLYTGWRFPDVLPSQGQQALDARQVMLDRVLKRVRADAFLIVKEKTPLSYKQLDTNTFTESLTISRFFTATEVDVQSDVDDLTSLMGEIGIHD
ncbi:hypothetical protein B0T22DRAFT_536567 [Podospora appendiculata]|uniref:Uncharacterized protein n=1 Tax=Podospora appendiculata TaxID=314037 RepID=A0AAE0XBV9_9PEZI|nr:hypothetical protein B0T22DRAFT_536567 [Podospora appendiculata]